jgi:hypothetical protein
MANSEMTKPWVVIAAGVSVLFVIGLVVRYAGPSDSRHSVASRLQPTSVERAVEAEPSGWVARPDTGAVQKPQGGVSARPGVARGIEGSAAVVGRGANAPAASGDATVGYSRSRVGDGGGSSQSTGRAGSDVRQVEAAIPAVAAPFEGARPVGGGRSVSPGGHEERVVRDVPPDAAKPEQTGEDGLVLSLPLQNSTVPEKGDTAPVVEQGVTFESGAGAKFSTNSQFVIPDGGNINGDAGTIAFTIEPDWAGGEQTDASMIQLRTENVWDNRLQIFKNGRYLRFILTDNTGSEREASTAIDNWQPGQQYQIAATWGDAQNALYVNGQMVAQNTYAGQLQVAPGTPLYIGSDYPGSAPGAKAQISNLKIYNKVVPPTQ